MSDEHEHQLDLHDLVPEGAATPPRVSRAVAVQYDKDDVGVPVVTASGKGVIAEQILAIAFAQGIKVRSDADLLEVLQQVEVDSPIPLEAFAAVAEILSYVYKANASMKQRQASRMHREDPL